MIRTRQLAIGLALALSTLAPVKGSAQSREWVEDYTEEWEDSDRDYDVSVDDLNVSGAVTLETFQGPLSAHGDWVVAGSYGRVWRPHVAAGWRPYYYGNWQWTNEGWFWVSDEPWGWAAYHYGRWAWEPGYGWFWVPGFQWAPAWVSWRYSGDVIGWAPLAPGLSLYVTNYPFHDVYWTFVPTVRFVGVPVYRSAYGPSYTHRYFRSTSPAPPPRSARPAPAGGGRPAPAWGGPAPRVIEQRTGRRVMPARVVPSTSPTARGRAGEIPVYRPEVRPGARAGGVAGTDRGRGRRTDAAAPPGRGGVRVPSRDGRAPGVQAPALTERRQPGSAPGVAGPSRGADRAPARAAPRGGSAAPRAGSAAPREGSAPPRAEPRTTAPGEASTPSAAPRSRGGSSSGGWSAPRQSAPSRPSAPARPSGGSRGGGGGGGGERPSPRR